MTKMKAKVVYFNVFDDVEQIELGEHLLQFGGVGDAYCYGHNSFDCLDALTNDEREALRKAE